jgi:hypothetical protein
MDTSEIRKILTDRAEALNMELIHRMVNNNQTEEEVLSRDPFLGGQIHEISTLLIMMFSFA